MPLLPAVLLLGFSETVAALTLLVLLLVQDGALVAAALVFANLRLAPTPVALRHPGHPAVADAGLGPAGLRRDARLRARLHRAAGRGRPISTTWEGSGGSVLVALAVIAVAPVAEEFFFRGFFTGRCAREWVSGRRR